MQSSASPNSMTMLQYHTQARQTARYPDEPSIPGISDDVMDGGGTLAVYPFLKLSGEVGEVNEKLGKAMRDAGGVSYECACAILKELGDVLWYVSACAEELGFTIDDVARGNLDKLSSRVARGTLQGSGDDR